MVLLLQTVHVLGRFLDFFRKPKDLKKIFAKKLFFDFRPLMGSFKAKIPKKWLFSSKNGHMQKFLWPEMWVVGAGWPKKKRPTPKTP